jgi:hypothetical protein
MVGADLTDIVRCLHFCGLSKLVAPQKIAIHQACPLTAASAIVKTIYHFLLIGLLSLSNGCMTYSSIQKAKGDQNVVTGDNPDAPHPQYYALLPLTVPLDVATSPIQLVIYILFATSSAPL